MNAWLKARLVCLCVAASGVSGCMSKTQGRSLPEGAVQKGERRLWCTYTYEGVAKRVLVLPTTEPYRAPMLELDRAFGLKWVYFIDSQEVAHLAVYLFDLAGDAPLPLHESKYQAPFVDRGRYGFTGLQLAYRSDGDELSYYCSREAP